MKTHEEILSAAIKKYGVVNQLDMVSEEVGELLKAINKIKRLHRNYFPDGVIPKPTSDTSVDEDLLFYDLCSEIRKTTSPPPSLQ